MRTGLLHRVVGIGLAVAMPAWSADTSFARGGFLDASDVNVKSSNGNAPFTIDGDEMGAVAEHFALQGVLYCSGGHEATDCPAPHWRIDAQYERADFDLESAGVGMTYRF